MSFLERLLKKSEPPKPKKKPVGIRVRYTGNNYNPAPGMVNIHLVPCMWLPMTGDSLYPCSTCGITHPVKTVHLWLDQNKSCIVSQGVLDLLKRAGLELNELEIDNQVDSPPPMTLNGKVSRRQVDQTNERINDWRNHG